MHREAMSRGERLTDEQWELIVRLLPQTKRKEVRDTLHLLLHMSSPLSRIPSRAGLSPIALKTDQTTTATSSRPSWRNKALSWSPCNRTNRIKPATQDGRTLRRYKCCWKV